MTKPTPRRRVILAASALLGLACAPLAALPAAAEPDSTATPEASGVVINEAYLSGGSAGAMYEHKFVELYNPTDAAIALDGMTLQYRSDNGDGAMRAGKPLTGSIEPGGYYLISGASNGDEGDALTSVNLDGTINPSGTNGTIVLVDGTDPIAPPQGDIAGADDVVDALGYGSAMTFEGEAAVSPDGTHDVRSNVRTDGVDTDNNRDDFSLTAEITPQGTGDITVGEDDEEEEPPEPTGPGEQLTIAEIQGASWSTPYDGDVVTTTGVVTAAYPHGGMKGFYLQTAGSGGDADTASRTASDGIFVYLDEIPVTVETGDTVTVNGYADEYYGLTQIAVASASDIAVDENSDAVAPEPAAIAFPDTDAERELFEGMLVSPQSDYTVTEVYEANRYGEVALAASTTPLVNPTVKGLPETLAYEAEVARAEAEAVTLDDGSTFDFTNPANSDTPLPYLSLENPVRVGAAVTFTDSVVLDYRFSTWKFQPTHVVTGDTEQPATFENTREDAPEDVGGDLKLGTFNVLNYFATTGDQRSGCTSFYTDRDDNPITVRDSSAEGCQVRGAANAENLERQQVKIVAAINALDADIVSLEEIENSLATGKTDRDYALSTLVDALNAAVGSDVWAFVPSPEALPKNEDVIRTAFIYKPAAVELVGEAQILIGSDAFENAREPDAQAFKPLGGTEDDTFVVVSNHLKSKGSAVECAGDPSDDDNCDSGEGIGGFNGDRTRQAAALVDFADSFAAKHNTEKVFLVGDFNSYAAEDPITTILAAGYVDQGAKTGEYTYNYGGAVGSLDYIFASPAADATVTGQDIWNINSAESVALEYSRYNYNVTNFYAPDVYRASDHDPMLVGIATSAGDGEGEEPGNGDNPGGDQDAGEPTPADDADISANLEIDLGLPDSLVRGQSFTVTLPDGASGSVAVWLHSEPVLLTDGYVTASDDGTVTVTVPADAPLGEHRVVVVSETGEVLGWQAVTVTEAGATASGDLPWTGTEALPLLIVALLLMALGGVVLVARRRRLS
ncbi:ExeM/NucH family extracellular endonuclease [Paramicrobacterium fandaimingii]|uniref:ExeM/NucH family extracellular endonuclease n=1 Tax=Paramicrobacterium fandaimingii TaxID=2708079 RepID=UPI00141DE0BE|nr:ExeM/NucH family extracellular endonuclease [Microbacterium fandaimingii]